MLFDTIKKFLFSSDCCKILPKPQGARILACSAFPELLIKKQSIAESRYHGCFRREYYEIQAGQGFAGNIQLFV